jgi:hypothetical protein
MLNYTEKTQNTYIQSGRGVALTTHAHLMPRLKKKYSHASTPSLGFRGLVIEWTFHLLYNEYDFGAKMTGSSIRNPSTRHAAPSFHGL